MFGFSSRQKPGELGAIGAYSDGSLRQIGHEHAAKKIAPERFLQQMQKQALIQCQENDGDWTTQDERLQTQFANQRQAVYNGFVRKELAEARLVDTGKKYQSYYGMPAPAEIPRLHGWMYYALLVCLVILEAPINYIAFQPLAEQSMVAAILLAGLVTGGVMIAAHVVGIYIHRLKVRFSRVIVYLTSICVILMVVVVAYLRYAWFEYESTSLSAVTLPPLVVAILFFVINMLFFGAGLLLSYALHEPYKVAYVAARRELTRAVASYESALEGTNGAYMTRMAAWRAYQKGIQQIQADYYDACGKFCTAYGEIPEHLRLPDQDEWPTVEFKVTDTLDWPRITGQERLDEQLAFISRSPVQVSSAPLDSGDGTSPDQRIVKEVGAADKATDSSRDGSMGEEPKGHGVEADRPDVQGGHHIYNDGVAVTRVPSIDTGTSPAAIEDISRKAGEAATDASDQTWNERADTPADTAT